MPLRSFLPQSLRVAARRRQIDISDRLDWHRLVRADSGWSKIALGARREAHRLQTDYQDYVTRVSAEEAAVSLETAGLLSALCQWMQPERVLDLGSGFSSVVLANRASTLSIDDDPTWRARTQEYATWVGTPVTLGGLDALEGEPPFDLVFHDLGNMVTRRAWLSRILDLTARIAVLDDAHKPGYEQSIREAVANRDGQLFSLAHLTRDRLGRYAMVWIASGGSPSVASADLGTVP